MPASLCVSSNGVSILLPENAALGVDLIDRQQHAVAEIGARHRAGAGQFENGGNVNGRLRENRTGDANPGDNHRRKKS